jgi:hypothetical protein
LTQTPPDLDELQLRYLNELNKALSGFTFAQLRRPILITTVPKCGTHLLRNIMLGFFGQDQILTHDFILSRTVREHAAAFDRNAPKISCGHLRHGDEAIRIAAHSTILVMVRDPYDYVLAYARFLYSRLELSPFARYVKIHRLPVDRVIAAVIFGNQNAENRWTDLRSNFETNAVAWLGGDSKLVRYEDLLGHVEALDDEAEAYFEQLLAACGSPLPEDWRARVSIAADRRYSLTARENLDVDVEVPAELSDVQKGMVDIAAPGLRRILGYGTRVSPP